MIISGIVAAAEDNAIGKDNQLPWHLPEDLKFFKRTTIGKPVIMGRKTFESLGRPLPSRLNVVLSKTAHLSLPEHVVLLHNVADAVRMLQDRNEEEVFIIGGGKIFEDALPVLERIYLTRIHTTVPDATSFFPHLDHSHWKLSWEEAHGTDDKHAFAYTFQKWDRIKEI